MSQHDSNYFTTHIISMGSKLFPSLKYTFYSIYSNTSPSTKHKLPNNLFKHTLVWVYVHIPFYSSMAISPVQKIMLCNMIQTIPLHILFQWDQNYSFHSNILSIQNILQPVHPLKTSYQLKYQSTH